MNQERELIYLAALLHDIGKFYQRADTGMVKDSCFLSDHVKTRQPIARRLTAVTPTSMRCGRLSS